MSESSQNGNRPGDPTRATPPKVTSTCWYCGHPNPTGTAILGSHRGTGTKIKVCAPGEGCKDGRIFHGPQADPHYPDQDCSICGNPAQRATERRLAGNAAKTPTPRRNISPRNR